MRVWEVVAALTLISNFGHAAGVNVTVEYRSTQTPRITVLADGRPVEGASVEFIAIRAGETKDTTELNTDHQGRAVPSRLKPGRYTVRATHHIFGISAGQLFLLVEDEEQSGPSERPALDEGPDYDHFTLNLDTRHENRVRRLLSQAQSAPIPTIEAEFSGIVKDASGASIPGASVTVLRRDNKADELLRIHADKSGEFRKDLPEGEYIAVCSATGFATSVVSFRIVHQNSGERLEIVLQIGPEVLPIT